MLVDGAALQNKNYYHFPNENTVEIKNLSLQDYISIYKRLTIKILTTHRSFPSASLVSTMKPLTKFRSLLPGNKKHSKMIEHQEQLDQAQQDHNDHAARVDALKAMKRLEHDQRENSIPRLSRMLPKGPHMRKPETIVEDVSSASLNSSDSSRVESFRRLGRSIQKSFRNNTSGSIKADQRLESTAQAESCAREDENTLQESNSPSSLNRKPSSAPSQNPAGAPMASGPKRAASAMPSLSAPRPFARKETLTPGQQKK